MKSEKRRCPHGFTLVELLVVIGIIALLMGILLPALAGARESSRATKCLSNLRQWGMAMQMYADENKQFIPADGGDGTSALPVTVVTPPSGPPLKLTWDSSSLWWNALPPYLGLESYYQLQQKDLNGSALPSVGSSSLFICPSMDAAVASAADNGGGVSSNNNYFLLHGAPAGNPNGDVVMKTCMCYVLNSKLNQTRPAQKITQLVPNSYVAIMVEKRMVEGELPKTDKYYTKALGQLKAEEKRFTARHHHGGHILFADGHVSWFSNQELTTPYPFATYFGDHNDPSKIVWDPFGPEF